MTNLNYTTKARLAKSCLILSVVFLCGCTFCNENETVNMSIEMIFGLGLYYLISILICLWATKKINKEVTYSDVVMAIVLGWFLCWAGIFYIFFTESFWDKKVF